MKICAVTRAEASQIAPLVTRFRVELRRLKGVESQPDERAGLDEINEYLDAGFPCYAAFCDDSAVGYIVCRVDKPTVWVESIYVAEEFRRQGIASALFAKAEELAAEYGEDTVFNYVHPNNDRMMAFLAKRGYNVLNLVEIRRAYGGEHLTRKYKIGENEFDY